MNKKHNEKLESLFCNYTFMLYGDLIDYFKYSKDNNIISILLIN